MYRLQLRDVGEHVARAGLAIAGVHGDVLFAVDRVRDRARHDHAAERNFPQHFAGIGIEGVEATIEVGIPGEGGEIAFGLGHIWATLFQIPISKIDPETNKVVGQWVGEGGDSIRAGHGSVWLSNLRAHTIWRIDPKQL